MEGSLSYRRAALSCHEVEPGAEPVRSVCSSVSDGIASKMSWVAEREGNKTGYSLRWAEQKWEQGVLQLLLGVRARLSSLSASEGWRVVTPGQRGVFGCWSQWISVPYSHGQVF